MARNAAFSRRVPGLFSSAPMRLSRAMCLVPVSLAAELDAHGTTYVASFM
jgi:hypothetical protein